MNEGVWKSFGFDYAQPPGFVNYVRRPSVCAQPAREENNFLFPSLKGGKLFIVTSALKSQRRVRCEFCLVCFLEIDFLLHEIN